MKAILRYLNGYKKESILAPLFKMLEACFELLIPLVMAKIVDVGIANGDISYILKMCAVMVALGVIGLVCSITAQFFSAKAAVGFGTALRKDLFAHITSLSYAELDHLGTSTLLTRMINDVNQLQTGVNLVLRLFLRSPFIVFGAMFMAFTVDVKSAMTFVVTIPALSIVVFGVMFASIPLFKKVQARLDRVTLLTRESLLGVRVIRAFNRQKKESEEFHTSAKELRHMQIFVGKISAVLNPVTYAIINVSTAAIIWIAAGQTYAGILTQGAVVALINYMGQILVELIKLANLIINITKSVACGKRVAAVFEVESSVKSGDVFANENADARGEDVNEECNKDEELDVDKTTKDNNVETDVSTTVIQNDNSKSALDTTTVKVKADITSVHKIEFKNVSIFYGSSTEPSLSDATFTVSPGQTIGIIGGTGSGKTTLVNLIPRFYDATHGEVLVDGVNVREYNIDTLRKKIGMVPQKAVLFKGTIADNIRFGKTDATDEDIWQALELAQAKEFVEGKDGGLDFMVSQGGKNLSGGQKQRLTIARALVRKPEILILDDSSSALDYATDAALRRALSTMTGTTTFVVTQRPSTIMHADKVLVMDDGHIVAMGTHKELLESCHIYQELCASTLGEVSGS